MPVLKKVDKTNINNEVEQVTVMKPGVYDVVKKLVQVILPAFASLYFGLAQIWGLPAADEVVGTAALVTTFLGVSLGISHNRWKSSDAGTVGEFVVQEDGGGAAGYRLVVNEDPEAMADKERITFKVNKQPV